jgi:uncharacterized membrane protein YagU involved in acid resistance
MGFLAGLISTEVMSLTEYPIWRKWGMAGVSEWHLNQVIMSRFLHRPAEALITPGLALHFLHGGLAGIVFAVILPILHVHNTVAAGVIFGVVLWIIALLIMKPVTGTGFRGYELGWLALVVSLLGHLIYGILLGLLAGLM